MTDGDAPAPAVFLGEIADQQGVELLGRGAAVEMHVDVDVEFARHLEDAADLSRPVGVVVGRGADHGGAALERGHHQFVGAGIVEQTLLRHDADFEVDRPAVAVDQRLDAFESAQPDLGIDLDMGAHAGGAVADALLDRARGALGDILDRKSVLDGRDPLHGEMRKALGLAVAARQDARLVEMDVGLDEAGADQPAATLHLFLCAAAQPRRDRGDAAVLHADVGRRLIGLRIGQPHVTQHEIEIHRKRSSPPLARMVHHTAGHS